MLRSRDITQISKKKEIFFRKISKMELLKITQISKKGKFFLPQNFENGVAQGYTNFQKRIFLSIFLRHYGITVYSSDVTGRCPPILGGYEQSGTLFKCLCPNCVRTNKMCSDVVRAS